MQGQPIVVKGLLKFKTNNNQISKKSTAQLPPKPQTKIQELQKVQQKLVKVADKVKISEQKSEQSEVQGKTAAEKAFEIAKKTRLIHKYNQRSHLSNRQRLQKRNKILSKLPDHEDLFKTGQKIQKGY